MKKALIVIDVQNEYFEGGAFVLWNGEQTLENIKKAILAAQAAGAPVILVRHAIKGETPFFGETTKGRQIRDDILAMVPDATPIIKYNADVFYETDLDQVLQDLGVDEVILCGMMTHNCVLFSALSRDIEKYNPKVIPEACTTVNEIIHMLALQGLATRVPFVSVEEAF